ncbi:MAG: YkgJ family cysteine cluster protein [Deltaproteobacteria bacterium]|nr:YkgJ family cysteine cluster protein [Deltaproteobacteria bacterium]MBW2208418.1 YkgJ family cysteine cluster protein [Deltaproteobacteria bacterium]
MQKKRDHCIRCGECCHKSSPTLHVEDLFLVKKGLVKRNHLYTIRKGEAVHDNVKGCVVNARIEMIKVREGEEGGCIFFEENGCACAIYENRPVQCSALQCWDTRDFLEVYEGPKLDRHSAVDNEILMGLIEGHEKRCAYETLEGQIRKIPAEGDKAIEEVLRMLQFDFELRPMVVEKLGLLPEEVDFFFGRPLVDTIGMFGLKVVREPDGSFLLTKA